jgi:hypothetical protein
MGQPGGDVLTSLRSERPSFNPFAACLADIANEKGSLNTSWTNESELNVALHLFLNSKTIFRASIFFEKTLNLLRLFGVLGILSNYKITHPMLHLTIFMSITHDYLFSWCYTNISFISILLILLVFHECLVFWKFMSKTQWTRRRWGNMEELPASKT